MSRGWRSVLRGAGEHLRMTISNIRRRPFRPSPHALVAALAVSLVCGSCSTPTRVPFTHLRYWNGSVIPGYSYPVQRGDTLASIAQHFGCDLSFLADVNRIVPGGALGAGERVFIPRTRTEFPQSYYAKPHRSEPIRPSPEATRPTPDTQFTKAVLLGQPPQAPTVVMMPTARPMAAVSAQPASFLGVFPLPSRSAPQPKSVAVASARTAPAATPAPLPQPVPANRQKGLQIAQGYSKHLFPATSQTPVSNAPRFQWPLSGTLSSLYNVSSSGRRLHLGIDISNKRGTPIRAAYPGRVIYSDSKYLPSMGNMVLLEHASGWITLYAHNDRNLVKEGDLVEAGQMIATAGATGNATGPHLHFEIRKDANTPVNPLSYLPARS